MVANLQSTIANVVFAFEKNPKLDYGKCVTNIQKILEKLMYKRLYTSLNNNNIIYNLQFGFGQQHATSHALINITDNIRRVLDNGNVGCRVVLELQFTVAHQILFGKLNHYGIQGVFCN